MVDTASVEVLGPVEGRFAEVITPALLCRAQQMLLHVALPLKGTAKNSTNPDDVKAHFLLI